MVVSAVPSASYKVKTEWLKDGCICLNIAADKNFEKDVRDKVSWFHGDSVRFEEKIGMTDLDDAFVGLVIRPCCRKSDDLDVAEEFVSTATVLLVCIRY